MARFFLLAVAGFVLLVTRAFAAPPLPEIHGFAEADYAQKFSDEEPTQKEEFNLLEQRFQLKASWRPTGSGWMTSWNPELYYKGDLIVDEHDEEVRYKIREFNVLATPLSVFDVKLGRQILTWGTGDLLFINDLFPKDYVSFFIGRDDEYLKVPSDAGKFSFYTPHGSLDFVWIPFFTPDVPLSGDQLSFFDPFLERIAGDESELGRDKPPRQIDESECAGRFYRNIGDYELALYAFKGFFNQARGIQSEKEKRLFYPELAVYGGSVRGPMPGAGGIVSGEIGYYDSLEDRSGKNPSIENGSMKYLTGYEYDFPKDLRVAVQYFVEQMLDFDEFKDNLEAGDFARDRFRQLLTLRLTKLFFKQTLEVSFFAFYSPTDEDAHLRPRMTWQISDQWKASVGSNIFFGKKEQTEFGQLQDNDNLYIRIRFSF